jgi:metal-responsive CopG/Arc/MetJ family transcriptional regulator
MRITTHIPDNVANEIKVFADNEHRSVSSVVADAVQHYISEKRKRYLGTKVLEMAGKIKISDDVHKEIESGRINADDRS